mmetsp:Transcript_11522/g.16900  ORF Transcript_11522/g.16900 Transcript_11522/m.16900 type:complete len:225 (+) Transcript_11522:117-791(+)|eukprot:CAMPEP_0194202748 /NCGR_PEP_ID=MMETSP0156-20130528/2691_1 /TAXON_ID=33649 /ORGANISM="Thalassionema nitzschioides, Strain L26-B" /LENGTH=224 /DNA_ID=CAMNT_0038928327 /DNA_START=107 /DNA_END=781 /DNA_ORIENTATION=+
MAIHDQESSEFQKFQAPPLENGILQQRLVQGVGGGTAARGSLSKCAIKYRDFASKFRACEDADAIKALKQDLIQEFQLYQLEMRKIALSVHAAEVDAEEIISEISAVKLQREATEKEIEDLRKEHPDAKQVRRNLEEYEALAKLANTRPPRRELELHTDEIKQQLAHVEDETQKNRDEKSLREKQFHLFMQSLFDLKESLAEDNEENIIEEDEDEGEVKPMDTT